MDLKLRDKVILITGGAQGIGGAISRSCAREGAFPVIFDCDGDAIEKLQAELGQNGLAAEAIRVDLTEHASTRKAVEVVGEKFGRIDGLVNNAGLNDGVGLEHGSPERFMVSLERNLVHYYTMVQNALPLLKRSRGSIVNISSKVALTGQGGSSGYAAAKGAILGLTEHWAAELSEFGIRVNVVLPAEVMTPQYEKWIARFDDPKGELQRITSKIPLGKRMTEPDEIAAMVVFLLSEESGGFTGQYFFVDGGYVHLDRRVT